MDNNYLLSKLLNDISKQIGWPDFENLQNHDYEIFSDRVEEKTGVSLSISTLKRITGKHKYPKGNTSPRATTLDALAKFAGYKDWQNYTLLANKNQEKKKLPRINLKIPLLLIVVLSSITLIYFFSKEKKSSINSIEFSVPDSIMPGYAQLTYNINKKLKIIHDWDEYTLDPNLNYYKIHLRYPDLKSIKIQDNNKTIFEKRIPVYTNKWTCILGNEESWEKFIYQDTAIIKNGIMSVDEKISSNYFKNNNNAREEYILGKNFGDIYLNNCIIEARFRYIILEGFDLCQKCYFIISGRKNDFSIPFSNFGCSVNLDYHIGRENLINSRTHDISEFERDMSIWRKIKVESKSNKIIISIDNEKFKEIDHNVDFGKLFLFNFSFSGHGEVDYIKVWNSNNKLVYSNDFN